MEFIVRRFALMLLVSGMLFMTTSFICLVRSVM